MGKAFQSHLDVPPPRRLPFGWARRGGLVVCLCTLSASANARPATVKAVGVAAPSFYQRALDSFHRQNYAEAARLLDRAPDAPDADPKAHADILNLRGAIYLRQLHFDKARALFTQAIALDPDLWAARFNLAEIAFRQKHYADSQQQFDALLDHTNRSSQPDEWRLVQYKMLLSTLLDGKEADLTKDLDRLGKERKPALGYYYLRAATESRRNRPVEAQKWLAQASAAYPPDAERVYAESFQQLGWAEGRSVRLIAASESARPKPMPVLGPGASPVAAAFVKEPPLPEGVLPLMNGTASSPATLAVVQLMPQSSQPAAAPSRRAADVRMAARLSAERAAGAPSFRFGPTGTTSAVRENSAAETASMPPQPADADDLPTAEEPTVELHAGFDQRAPESAFNQGMLVMARKPTTKKPASSNANNGSNAAASAPPTPSPAATAAAAAGSPSVSTSPTPSVPEAPTPAPSPTPSAEPAKPEFLERYEAAFVAYTGKDYAAAKAALDDADRIQPNQPSAIDLRGKIFAYYYQAAYVKYLEKDYPGSQETLNLADQVQRNQPDSLNLRGLIMSRQRNYEEAEGMFAQAIKADPNFWAAKFNLAELPFTRRNYTQARERYEKLLTETDPSPGKQEREAELTQFKIFLTLLLQGKETAARDFMDHFKFTGKTPARYYCQAALEFYSGSSAKAQEWIGSAKKDYPPQIEAIFADSFYRVGWLTDPNSKSAPGVTPAVAMATPSPSPESTTASPSPTAALAASSVSPSPSASPAAVAAASAAPSPKAGATAPAIIVAKASPSPSPFSSPAASAAPTTAPILTASRSPSPSPTAAAISVPTPAATPAIAAATPTAAPSPKVTAAPAVAVASVSPSATPAASSSPAKSPAETSATGNASPVMAAQSPEESEASPAVEEETTGGIKDDYIYLGLGLALAAYLLMSWGFLAWRVKQIRKARKAPLRYSGRKTAPQPVETSR